MNRACLVVAVLITVSCEGDRPSPLPRSPTGPTGPMEPPAPRAPVITDFAVQELPPRIGPGESARVQAIARFSDGSERDVAAEATWTSTQPTIATVEAGVVTGRALGRVTIQARYESRTSTLEMVIQPAGTFSLFGLITEPGPVTVDAATVALEESPNQVTSDRYGHFELFGVSGRVTVRASKPGYRDDRRRLTVTEDQGLELQIRPLMAPTSIAGNYRVTLAISPSCAIVPDDQKARTYTAVIEQTGAFIQIRLGDANFGVDQPRNTFQGKVTGSTVTFEWGEPYYYYYYHYGGIQEILPGGQILTIFGQMQTQSAQTMSGNLVGMFSLRENNNRTRTRTCSTSDSTVVFTRTR